MENPLIVASQHRRKDPDSPSRGKTSSSEDAGTQLIQLGKREWADDDQRSSFLKETDESYRLFLDEFFNFANDCVDLYEKNSRLHRKWRRTIIIATGVVAIVNLLAAALKDLQNWMPILAAVCAAGLGILASLESFNDFQTKAQAYRESRDIYLDAGREFSRLWDSLVRPFGTDAEACLNASELYRRVVAKDRELRLKVKELTKTDKKRPSSKP